MSITSEINDCILKNNGSERDALNVTLAKLHDAEGRISSLRAILFDILEDDEPAQPEGDAAYWRAKAEAFQARAKYLENKYRWIPVTEGEIKDLEYCILCVGSPYNISIPGRHVNERFFSGSYPNLTDWTQYVTHYQLLPEPVEEE